METNGSSVCKFDYKIAPGIIASTDMDAAKDQLLQRMSQLSAILKIMCSEQFSRHSTETQADTIWLAQSLMSEISALSSFAIPPKSNQ